MNINTVFILIIIWQSVISRKWDCIKVKHKRYGGALIMCPDTPENKAIQEFGGKYYLISYKHRRSGRPKPHRPKPVGPSHEEPGEETTSTTSTTITTETIPSTTTVEATTIIETPEVKIELDDSTNEIVVTNSTAITPGRRQLITVPSSCDYGFDAEGGCIAQNELFN